MILEFPDWRCSLLSSTSSCFSLASLLGLSQQKITSLSAQDVSLSVVVSRASDETKLSMAWDKDLVVMIIL